MLTDDEVRDRLIETARAAADAPPSTEEVLQAGRRQRWRMRLALGALVLTGGLIFVAVSYAGFYGRDAVRPFNVPLVDQPTVVPDLEGLTLGEAEEVLEDAGLKADPESKCEQGTTCEVSGQSPRKATRVEEGTAVKLTLARRRSERVRVPLVEDRSLRRALARLRAVPLRASLRGDRCPASTTKCIVVDQSPEARVRRRRGSRVILTRELRTSPPNHRDDRERRGDRRVTMPSVTGLTLEAAENRLQRFGFRVDPDVNCPEPTVPCRVTDQSPDAARSVQRGTVVKLTLRGGKLISVPNVVGDTEAEAKAQLEKKGLEAVGEECPVSTACEVTSQEPVEGTTVVRGTEVTLEIDEIPPEMTRVPEVEGDLLDVAISELDKAQLEPQGEVLCPDGKKCVVATQSLPAETEVPVGSKVELTLRQVEDHRPEETSTEPEPEQGS